MRGTGRLALWHTCAPGHEAAFEEWYKTEHLAERLAIPGFLRGRRWEAASRTPGFFTYYETVEPEILTSAAYKERLDAPTPATRYIMSNVMRNLSRTICWVDAAAGNLGGSWALSVLNAQAVDTHALAKEAGVARVEVWRATDGTPDMSEEEAIRGGDQRIESCLVVETMREDDAVRIAARLSGARTWRLLCEMRAEDVV